MSLVVVGHVDHGKSTVLGRLLSDTGVLPEGKLEQVRAFCERNARPFEYAFLLDALKDEQAQGITIDAARVFFKTAKRKYIIIDAPGHIEFLRNMVTGAARAEAALLVIDAAEGIQENSKRHGYMLSLLGVNQVAVLVNKMDLVAYSQKRFDEIREEYGKFLARIGVTPKFFVPISGLNGENLASRSKNLPWYTGKTVLEVIDSFEEAPPPDHQPFRMPVQDVYRFSQGGDNRRIVAGTVESGTLADESTLVFYPSGKRSRLERLESLDAKAPTTASSGQAIGFTLKEQIYITRGEIAAIEGQPPPSVSKRFRASLFWLGKEPLAPEKTYILKLCTGRARARIEKIVNVIDASSLVATTEPARVEKNSVAECIFKLDRPLAFDAAAGAAALSRFVLIEDFNISGGGIVREALPDDRLLLREKVVKRNLKWEQGSVAVDARSARFGQKPTLILVTGAKDARRKEIAKALEKALFDLGKLVYYLGYGSILYGVSADAMEGPRDQEEELRRLAEVANLLLDAGMILVISAQELRQSDLEVFREAVGSFRIRTVWVGSRMSTDIQHDLIVDDDETDSLARILRALFGEAPPR